MNRLRYFEPAENSITGWAKESLPIGNGFFWWKCFWHSCKR